MAAKRKPSTESKSKSKIPKAKSKPKKRPTRSTRNRKKEPPMDSGKAENILIAEGGAMRGIFSAGVLDVFYEQGFDPFDFYIGVSAGSCNLSSHLAGQPYRNYRAYMYQMSQRNFVSKSRLFTGGSVVDLTWLFDRLAAMDPLDIESAYAFLNKSNKSFCVTLTDTDTGQPVYWQPNLHDWFDAIKAGCALPLLYKGPIVFNGGNFADGGVADPLPIDYALTFQPKRIVVLRSRTAEYRKKDKSLSMRIAARHFSHKPAMKAAILDQALVYNKSAEKILSYSGPPRFYI